VLRLRGKGLPEFGAQRRGDLFLAIRVHVPERLSREERKHYEELRKLENRLQSDRLETAKRRIRV
jgi:molecular chaperone DnaJ